MNVNLIIMCGLIVMIFIVALLYRPILEGLVEVKNKEVEIKKSELFISISADAIEQEIDKFFDKYVKRYILYKFAAHKIVYINDKECEEMVKNLTELIALEISELYIFYMKMILDIKDSDSLIREINVRVKNKVAEEVSNYNSQLT